MRPSDSAHHDPPPTFWPDIATALTLPLTVRQLARRTGVDLDTCCWRLRVLRRHGLVACLSPLARRSRVYALTAHGNLQRRALGLPQAETPDLDWHLYSWVCFRYRAIILRMLTEPLQPATIKRKARFHDPTIRMSANNARAVIYLFRQRGIVRPVQIGRKAHLRYELTPRGAALQEVLLRARGPPS